MNSEATAREIAKARGHRDLDHIIICSGGEKVPVWVFYLDAAEAEQPDTSQLRPQGE